MFSYQSTILSEQILRSFVPRDYQHTILSCIAVKVLGVWVDKSLNIVLLMSRDTVMAQYRVISLSDTPGEGRGGEDGLSRCNGMQFEEQVGERVQTARKQMFVRCYSCVV